MIKLVEEYTKRELQDIFEFCCDMLVERDDIPIPFDRINPTLSNHLRVNNRRVLGQCNRKFCGYDGDGNREYTYDISLNPNFMKYGKEYYQEIIATIAHELTHTINGCFNHGTEFMRYGKMIGDVLGCKVDQKADSGESELFLSVLDKPKYALICSNPNCDTKETFSKLCNAIRNPKTYRCAKCKSPLDSYVYDQQKDDYKLFIAHDDELMIAKETGSYIRCDDCGNIVAINPKSMDFVRGYRALESGTAKCAECGSKDIWMQIKKSGKFYKLVNAYDGQTDSDSYSTKDFLFMY